MEPHEHQPNDHSEPDDREADLPTQLPPRTEPADPEQPVPMSAEEYRRLLQRKIRRMYPWSLILFAAACASTFYVGGQQANGEFSPVSGATYAAGVMGILLAHELGHYFQALRYGVPASPPMFIPMPFLPLGTMGAVIVQGAGFADRKALFDIAISGPLAGLVLALPIAWWGLQDSTVTTIDPTQGAVIFGDPLILEWMYEARHGVLAANQEVVLNPLLFAGWVGIFITALNLVPIGQLDGGHIAYTLIGRNAHRLAYAVVGGSIVWMVSTRDPSFLLMIGLLYAFGLKHPPTANDSVRLGPVRTIAGWLSLAFVVIGFTPFPITAQQPEPPAAPTPSAIVPAAAMPLISAPNVRTGFNAAK